MLHLAFYKEKKIIYLLFLNPFPPPYLCLHVDYPPCLTSVNYCLTAQTSSKGSAPSKSGMT